MTQILFSGPWKNIIYGKAKIFLSLAVGNVPGTEGSNISSDGVLLSLGGKPPTVRNTCLTTPHIADLVAALRKDPHLNRAEESF